MIFEIRARLDGAIALTGDGALTRDFGRAHALAKELVVTYDLAISHELALSCDFAVAHEVDLARARGLARALACASDQAFALAVAVAGDQALALALSHALARTVAGATRLAWYGYGASEDFQRLVDAVNDAHEQAIALQTAASTETKHARQTQERAYVAVSWTATRMAAWSVRMLPLADRARYDEEFRGELCDLAAAGTARRDQFWHAVRLLTHAVQLRVEVEKARSRRAVS